MIKTIKLQNFRSYQQKEMHLTAGINVLAGDTGVGKTNVIMAIGAAMFGYLPRGKQLVMRGSKSGSVEINLDDRAWVKRTFGTSSVWTVAVEDRDCFGIVAEGVDDVSAWIKNYLCISSPAPLKSIWANALMVAQFGVRDGFGLSSTARRQYFDGTVDVGKYEKIWSWLREPLNHIGTKINALELEVARLEPVAERLDDLLASELKVSQRLGDLKSEYTEVDLLLIPECKEFVRDAEGLLKAHEDVCGRVKIHNEGVERAVNLLKTRRAVLIRERESLSKLHQNEKSLRDALEWLAEHSRDFEAEQHNLRVEIDDINLTKGSLRETRKAREKQLAFLNDGTCPTCLQDVSDEYASKTRVELRSNISEIVKGLEVVEKKLSNKKSDLLETVELRAEALLKKQIAVSIGDPTSLADKTSDAESDIRSTELEIKEVEEAGLDERIPSKSSQRKLTAARLTLAVQQKELITLRNRRAVIKSEIDNAGKETDRLGDEIELAEDATTKITSKTVSLGGLEGASDLLAEIRAAIRSAGPEVARRKVALVSRLANQMFSGIWEHRSGELKWLEDYSIQVMLDGVEHGFDVSGGQGVLAAWCIRLALAKVLGQAPLLVLDEATMGSLDDEMVHVIPELIASTEVDQMIVVDHGGIFDAVASNTVSIYNNSGISEVK